jgi:type IV secretory pathway VirB6-like protein
VGPCALDYTKMKTADHFWTDPPADELVQRHRIHSSGKHALTNPSSPKRPGLQVYNPLLFSSMSLLSSLLSSFIIVVIIVIFFIIIITIIVFVVITGVLCL